MVCEQSSVMDKIEGLQFHENQKVYEKAVSILEEYFQIEDNEDIVGMLNNTTAAHSEQSSMDQFKQAFDF